MQFLKISRAAIRVKRDEHSTASVLLAVIRMTSLKRRFFALFLAIVVAGSAHAETVTVSSVIDGDTFRLTDGRRVRIMGIDALELHTPSTEHLASLIDGKQVILEFEGDRNDIYGRTLAYVSVEGVGDVGAQMLRDGFAFAYLKYPCSRHEQYIALEIEARKAVKGIWTGRFQSNRTMPSSQADPGSTDLQSADKDDKSVTVYITRTGKKYHRGGCRYLGKSKIAKNLKTATASYGPCSVCSPPTMKATTSSTSSSYEAPKKTESGRCTAITKKGTRCKRNAKAGSSRCWQH